MLYGAIIGAVVGLGYALYMNNKKKKDQNNSDQN